MQPNHSDILDHRNDVVGDTRSQRPAETRPMSRSATDPRRFMSEDSWIEISSQPSSSSLSSVGDEIVTTGLQVQNEPRSRRRRRPLSMVANTVQISPRPTSAASSSQDEYEESSSESDRVLSSSNEDIARPGQSLLPQTDERVVEDDEDDTSTALGTGTSESVFTPQPNAFSHPPSSQTSRANSASLPKDSYFSSAPSDRLPNNRTITPRDAHSATSSRSQRGTHTPYNMIAPSHTYQPDHDAALRASLSTLLSCAAAARGLPKRDTTTRTTSRRPGGDTIDTNTIRMVPESALRNDSSPPPLPSRRIVPPASPSLTTTPSPPSSIKTKRKAVRETSKDRHSKKSRGSRPISGADEAVISPTLMTWMISAGVVVLFSAISFSAGFVWGREIGRLEGGGLVGAGGLERSCGQEMAARAGGLKRLRWGAAGTSSIRA